MQKDFIIFFKLTLLFLFPEHLFRKGFSVWGRGWKLLCKYLLKDVLQLITAILRKLFFKQVVVSSVEWQFLLKCGNRASYGT